MCFVHRTVLYAYLISPIYTLSVLKVPEYCPLQEGAIDAKRIQDSFFSKRLCFQIEEEEDVAATCAEELARRLPYIALDSWPQRFELGGVYLAGRAATPSAQVVPPCRLEYYEPVFDIAKASEFYPQFSAEWILDLDEDLGVAYKPPGLPTTPARDQAKYNLARYLGEHFSAPVHTPSRLDTAVDGLLLFSRSSRMNRALQRAYDKHRIEKVYLALVTPAVEWKMLDVEAPIARDQRHPVLRCVDAERGESAHTRLDVLLTDGGHSLVQAQPFTGRTHQIRLHCAASGAPIVGDPYYGGADASRVHLTSFALRFFHPYQQVYKMYVLPKAMRPEWLRSIEAKYGDIAERLLLNPVERYGV